MKSSDMILEASVIGWQNPRDLPYLLRIRGADGRDHVEKGFHRIRACKLDQANLVSDLESVRRHGLVPRSKSHQSSRN